MFRPKNTSPSSVQQLTAEVPATINEEQNRIEEVDSNEILSRPLANTLKREKRIVWFAFWFWFGIFIAAWIGVLMNYFLNTIPGQKESNPTQGLAWYIMFALIILISFALFIKATFKISAIKKTLVACRESTQSGDIFAANTTITDIFRATTMKKMRLSWIFAFVITYFGLFNLIILMFLNIYGGIWEIHSNSASFKYDITINWWAIFDNAFGNVKTLLWVDLGVAFGIITLFVFTNLYDTKRIMDLKKYLGQDANTIITTVNSDKSSENKAWFKVYIIVFVLVVLMPLALLLFLLWRGIIRKGKK
ncbi:hypothetical protein H9M94_00080 [Mycoplasma sp. Pen4]|uniref:MSC_0882 family membrane protein n=1 Tax=Mycoplasma sp. Pen4 TaxID=640330 RepID=UPI001654BE47|nr:hypothetical protein [Mycoplasma sp. Pen4]QNM93664.1 hypothetical protein H9M94_00080 [Mycoplasma sp. Pen4]